MKVLGFTSPKGGDVVIRKPPIIGSKSSEGINFLLIQIYVAKVKIGLTTFK